MASSLVISCDRVRVECANHVSRKLRDDILDWKLSNTTSLKVYKKQQKVCKKEPKMALTL